SLAKPSFPELLGHEDIPVYYDEERGQTLYARIGTNISGMETAEVVDTSELPQLFDATLKSSGNLLLHKFNLGTYTGGAAAIVRIDYDAESLEQAREIANQFKVNSNENMTGTPYPIVVYDGRNMESANANLTFDMNTKKA